MSSIKVVDVNNEEDKQEELTEPIEEAKEEIIEQPIEEVKQETNEATEESKEVLQVEKKVSPQNKLVRCPKCNREMKLKSYRYGHEQKCQGTLEQKPVKPFSKPRATPKSKTQPIIKEVEEEVIEQPKPKLSTPVSNQVLKPRSAGLPDGNLPRSAGVVPCTNPPSNPLADLTNHYQLLQNQYIQQKKEKYNNLCQSMFSSKSKKR